MSRKPRIHYPGALYHVILRGNARGKIFFDVEDRRRFYLLLQEGVERYGCRVHAFCLMTNHVHLAVQVGEAPLSRIMHGLAFRYTRWVNRRQNRVGHLFQGRYRAILVDAESYLLELVRYIHLNPVRAGIVSDPADYPWSGHRSLLGQEPPPWMTTDWVLSLFDQKAERARRTYHQFVADGQGEGHRREFHVGGQARHGLLGDDRFIEQVFGRSSSPKSGKVTIADIVDAVCRLYGVDLVDLSAAGKSRTLSEARAVAACLVQEREGLTLVDLGRLVRRDVSSLSSAARRLAERARVDGPLAQRLVAVREENS